MPLKTLLTALNVRPSAPPRHGSGGALRALCGATTAALFLALAAPAATQTPFAAAVWVNDQAITHHEIDQRARFLAFIGAGGPDPRTRARDRLIEERLQMQAGRRYGLRATPEQITEGMTEFARRADLTAEELIDLLRRDGIAPDTFREFVHAGVIWRELVQGRFGPDIRVTEAQVDRALSVANVRPVEEVLISEIFLPTDPQFADLVQPLIPQVLAIDTLEEFAIAAREISAAPTAAQGGRVDTWFPLGQLPEQIAAEFEGATVAQVIGPLEVPGAYAFFQLRARREARELPAGQIELEFRRAVLPGGRSEANLSRVAALSARAERCVDFGPVFFDLAPELPAEAVETVTLRQPQLPAGIATELARLNPGGISANLVENGQLVVLQLCARRFLPEPEPTREQVNFAVFNEQIQGRAEVWLQTLREEAEIRVP